MGTPFKMKAGKEGPMKKNFGISPMKQDKAKASQTKINAKTGVTTVDKNPGSKKEFGPDDKYKSLVNKRPKNADGTPYTDKQMKELLKKALDNPMVDMVPNRKKGQSKLSDAMEFMKK